MQQYDFYHSAHLVVAAIRIATHQAGTPATREAICKILSFSAERVNFICHRLEQLGVLEAVETAQGGRLFIRDHRKIEEIARNESESQLDLELKKYQASRKKMAQKVSALKAAGEKKKKDMFADLQQRLKEELAKKS